MQRAVPWRSRPVRRRWRIAVPKGCVEKVQPAVRDNFEASLRPSPRRDDRTRCRVAGVSRGEPSVGTIVNAEGAAAFLPFIESGDVDKLRCRRRSRRRLRRLMTFAVDYMQAMRARAPMKRAVNDLFEKYDVIASPTRSTVSYPARQEIPRRLSRCAQRPRTHSRRQSVRLARRVSPERLRRSRLADVDHLMGPAFGEMSLLRLAQAYQDATDWHRRTPPDA